MKLNNKFLVLIMVLLAACGKPSEQSGGEGNEEGVNEDPNQALYDQVMNMHDEVMPKMEDIYKLKSQIQEKIANSPDMVKERKEALGNMILSLDSASNSMMDWMHQFEPIADTADQEQARAYLETQMEKIRKVKEDMVHAIELAQEANKN